MDELSREAVFIREDPPLPADLEDLEGDGDVDAESLTAHLVAPDPAVAGAPLDDYLDTDAAADTDASADEVAAAVEAAREDAGRFGADRRY